MFPVLFLYQRKNVDIALGPTQGPTLAYPNLPSLSGAPDGPPGCSGTLCKAPGGARDLAATQGALQPARLAQAGGG